MCGGLVGRGEVYRQSTGNGEKIGEQRVCRIYFEHQVTQHTALVTNVLWVDEITGGGKNVTPDVGQQESRGEKKGRGSQASYTGNEYYTWSEKAGTRWPNAPAPTACRKGG